MAEENRSIQMQLFIQLRAWIPHFTEAELRVWPYLASKVGRGDEKHLPAGEQRKLSVFPLVATIAKDTGLTDRGVRKALASLVKRGLLTKYSRGKAHGYVLNHRMMPNTGTHVPVHSGTTVPVSDENTGTTVPPITGTGVPPEGFNSEGINEELKGGDPTPAPTANTQEEPGKTEDEEKIVRVCEIAKSCGRQINHDPRWAELYDRLAPHAEPVLKKVFGKWLDFKPFAESHYDTYAWKKNPHAEPVAAHFAMEKWLGATAALAYLTHADDYKAAKFSDEDAA